MKITKTQKDFSEKIHKNVADRLNTKTLMCSKIVLLDMVFVVI